MNNIPPVPCPVCNESQNSFAGAFDPDQDPFIQVTCMVCGHVFEKDEFLSLVEQVRATSSVGIHS